ncbi:hypothetical protein NBRC111893_552 [Lentilactobacillus kosonis]|uniref:Uncharacterized protein n=1 Tax=Lentilactobacillus kosonis TaxID=2810561 RepID=A0A401FJD9_9LACO|nr:hypothetical protein [Lentilactobacillus kosonis]GAY72406.1 hypothetical protein NBRC111893_552 [Lentilactobacillus kosonis]
MTDFKTLFNINCFSTDSEAQKVAAEQLQSNYNFEITCLHLDKSIQLLTTAKAAQLPQPRFAKTL